MLHVVHNTYQPKKVTRSTLLCCLMHNKFVMANKDV